MPWSVVTVDLDSDKVGASTPEAGFVTATFDFGDGQPPFVHSKRVQRSEAAAFVAEAKARLTAYSTKRAREATLAANLLTALNQ